MFQYLHMWLGKDELSVRYIRGTFCFRRGKDSLVKEGQTWAPGMKCFQVELNTEGQGFFLDILLLDVGLRKAVVKEKLPRSWSEPISDLRTHDLIVNVILSRQPWHPTRGFCLSPYYFFSLKNHSHFTHYGGNISTTLYLKKKKKSNNKMNIYFFKKPTAKLHLTAAWKCSWFLNGWWGRTAWFPEWLLLLSPFCLCFNVFLWTVRRSVWKIVSSPVPAVLAPKGKALHRLRASGGPPVLTRASRTAPARCPRAGASETAAEPGRLSASRELHRGRTPKVWPWGALWDPQTPSLSLTTPR